MKSIASPWGAHGDVFLYAPTVTYLYILKVSHRKGGHRYALGMVSLFGNMCLRAWGGNFDRRDISGWRAPVPCGISADRLWVCVLAQIGEEGFHEDRNCQVA